MKLSKIILLFLLAAATFCTGSPAGAADKPQPREIVQGMSCGVCGMYPARFPVWQTQIIFNDGTMVPFDGSKDMFKYLLDMAKYNPEKTRADVAAIWVKERFSNKWIDGETAWYVVNSAVRGPMGKDLVPFADRDEAQGLQAENGGTVIGFSEVTMELVGTLGMGAHMGGGM